jgi:hypothetical protein
MADLPEAAFPIESLLSQITSAMATASEQLRKEFTSGSMSEAPYMYQLPRMSCQIKLSLSYTKEGVKGSFFKKTKTAEEQEIVSTIELEVVAVPRSMRNGKEKTNQTLAPDG